MRPRPPGFSDLLRRARAGESAACEEVATIAWHHALRLGRGRLGWHTRRWAETCDLASEVTAEIVRHLGAWGGQTEADLVRWVRTRLRQRAACHGRRARAACRDARRDRPLSESADALAEDVRRAPTPSPIASLQRRESDQHVRDRLAGLAFRERRLVEMRVQGVAWAYVAAWLGYPSDQAARKAWERLVPRLRELLGAAG